jgi:hypothetical protein
MIAEDSTRQLEPTLRPDETTLVRCLPVISERFLNTLALRLKTEQEAQVRAMATPKDNPWLSKLQDEYLGKILYDGRYFRVFAIQFVPNKTPIGFLAGRRRRNRFSRTRTGNLSSANDMSPLAKTAPALFRSHQWLALP